MKYSIVIKSVEHILNEKKTFHLYFRVLYCVENCTAVIITVLLLSDRSQLLINYFWNQWMVKLMTFWFSIIILHRYNIVVNWNPLSNYWTSFDNDNNYCNFRYLNVLLERNFWIILEHYNVSCVLHIIVVYSVVRRVMWHCRQPRA